MKEKVSESANGDGAEKKSVPAAPAESLQHSGLIKKKPMAERASVSLRTFNTWIRERKVPVIVLSPRCHRFDPAAVMSALKRFTIREVK